MGLAVQTIGAPAVSRRSFRYSLSHDAETTLHIVRYSKAAVSPRLVTFARPEPLADWCKRHGNREAINGGFFVPALNRLLGEHWLNGRPLPAEPIEHRWQTFRGCIGLFDDGIKIGPRHNFDDQPFSLLSAGPLLVSAGKACGVDADSEGFSALANQFDSDITLGRYPRAAVGYNERYIWSVVCDGRGQDDSGLTLKELAELMLSLGCSHALNLDGGSSASQISGGRLRNRPRGINGFIPGGRPVLSALVFDGADNRPL